MTSLYSLKEHFQLRNSHSFLPRKGAARVFRLENQTGLFDHTGAIWPVAGLDECSEDSLVDFHSQGSGYSGEKNKTPILLQVKLEKELPAAASLASSQNERAEWLRQLKAGLGLNAANITSTQWSAQVAFAPRGRASWKGHSEFQDVKREVSAFFRTSGYQEIEAPLVVPSGGIERHMQLFSTTYEKFAEGHATSKPEDRASMQLSTSPEFALKKCLAMGAHRVFSLAQSFRNGGETSPWHRPQFCMLEWYAVGQSIEAMIKQTHQLVSHLAVHMSSQVLLDEEPQIISVKELYQTHFKLNLDEHLPNGSRSMKEVCEKFHSALKAISVSVCDSDDWDTLYWKSFLDVIEPKLKSLGLVFITGFPNQFATLAAPEPGTGYARRFEGFLNGIEICNGYDELIDSDLISKRFKETLSQRKELQADEDFEALMSFGMPHSAGNALGLERVVSLLQGSDALSTRHPAEPLVFTK